VRGCVVRAINCHRCLHDFQLCACLQGKGKEYRVVFCRLEGRLDGDGRRAKARLRPRQQSGRGQADEGSAAAKTTDRAGTGGPMLGCGQGNSGEGKRVGGHRRASARLRPRQQSGRGQADDSSAVAKTTEPVGTGGQRLGCGQGKRAGGRGRAKARLWLRQKSGRAQAGQCLAAAKATERAGTSGRRLGCGQDNRAGGHVPGTPPHVLPARLSNRVALGKNLSCALAPPRLSCERI